MDQCPQCKSSVGTDDSFCENCGYNLRSDQPSPNPQSLSFQLPPALGSWKTLIWIIIGTVIGLTVVGALCGAGAYHTMFQKPTPEPQIVEVTVERVVTATPTATPSSTPGPSPTPSPTNTPTATSTPIPDTPPGTILKDGETWRQNGMTMRVEKFGLETFHCGNVLLEADFWGKWQVVIKNTTTQDLVLNITKDDFFLIDNEGVQARPQTDFYFSLGTQETCLPPLLDVQLLKSGEEIRLWGFGIGRINEREWVQFGVIEAGRIENARWQMNIPR